MTSTIKVNNIQNQCGANIINESSNTITLGASGDTIALASGASQTGLVEQEQLIGIQLQRHQLLLQFLETVFLQTHQVVHLV